MSFKQNTHPHYLEGNQIFGKAEPLPPLKIPEVLTVDQQKALARRNVETLKTQARGEGPKLPALTAGSTRGLPGWIRSEIMNPRPLKHRIRIPLTRNTAPEASGTR